MLVVKEDKSKAAKVIGDVMGERDSYYALEALNTVEGSVGLVLEHDGRVVGAVAAYPARGEGEAPLLGVIYYVAVYPKYWGRGYGKILVASAEEILEDSVDVDLFVSTIDSSNERSISLFKSLDYRVYGLEEASSKWGWSPVLGLLHAACSYEEDLIALKGISIDEKIGAITEDSYREVWWHACYKPWIRRWYKL